MHDRTVGRYRTTAAPPDRRTYRHPATRLGTPVDEWRAVIGLATAWYDVKETA